MMRAPVAPLFVPGDRPERFTKAAGTQADAVIIDLEDAVDATAKAAARHNLLAHGVAGKPVLVRINAATTPWFDDDLDALGRAAIQGVVLPKAETAAALDAVAAAAGPDVALLPLLETVRGLSRLGELLARPRVLCAGFGSLDFGIDAGCEPSWEVLLPVRSQIVLASRLAGIAAPIDGVTPVLDDPELVAKDARQARALGFGGKLAIHPRQVAPILGAFLPTPDEIAWARRVLSLVTSDAAIQVDGQMIDKPLVEKARHVLARAAGSPASD